MPHRQRRSVPLTACIALVAGSLLSPAPVDAQNVILSPVPKDPCCFNNFRFAGTCRVMPRQGQYCENILSYLNNFNSGGESYCNSTNIRGGWTLIDCASGADAPAIGTMKPGTIQVQEPGAAPVTTAPTAVDRAAQPSAPSAVDPTELTATDASVIQVRLEQPVSGGTLVPGQRITGRLEADVLGADGEIIAPAGSSISAEVGAEQLWETGSTTAPQLQFVATTTSAADLFGSAAPPTEPEAATVHLTGEVVEVNDDSLVTFQLKDVSEQPADMRVLTTATNVWMEAFNGGDAVTIAGLSSEDGALLPPNGRAVIGRDAIYAYWKEKLSDSANRVELVNVETVVDGDLGYKAGRFEFIDSTTDAPIDQGKYMQIWKRSPQGYWELHRDMWNSSLATPPSGR